MCKFIRIKSYKPLNDNEKYSKYIEKINELYQRYSKFLFDDFFVEKQNGVDELIENLSPYFWIITDRNDNFAGFVFIDDFVGNENKFFSAEVSVCFDKKYWGNFVRYSSKFFFKMCFDVFEFYKIKAQFYPQNKFVKKLLQDCGFEYEVTLPSETLRKSVPQDIEVWSLYRKYYYK